MARLLPPATGAPAALRACRKHFIGVALFSALLNLLFIVPMLYMLQVYDRVVQARSGGTLFVLTLVLLLGLITLSLLDWVRSRLLVRASLRLEHQLAPVILDASLTRRDATATTLTRQDMREFDVLRQTLTGPSLLALCDAPWSPIYILLSFLIHPMLGLLILSGAVALAGMAWLNERATGEPLRLAGEAASRSYVSQEQVLTGAETVRALGMRGAMVRRHVAERQTTLALQVDANFASSHYVAASKFLRFALQSLALGLGAWLAINDAISAGAIFVASFLAGRALQPIEQLLGSWPALIRARAAYHSLRDMLASIMDSGTPTRLPDPKGRLEADQIAVAGSSVHQPPILAGVRFAIEPGEVVAVVGPSGAGKSTLLRVLAGARAADRGIIRIDGANMADWDPDRLGRFIGFLPQQVTLFAGTIKDNISRFEDAADPNVDEKAVAAAKLARVHDMILRLPGGYDSALGWGGNGLSAGQAQRVGLARALYGDPPIVLLDEPNAHLDADGEAQLVGTLSDLKARGAAVMIVAHRMGILGTVDKIMILKDGRLDAFGPRDEIIGQMQRPQVEPRLRPVPLQGVGV